MKAKRLGQIRQGDVLLVPMDIHVPPGVRPVREVVLALGEMTGHAHRLAAPEVYTWEADGQRYVRVVGDEPGTLAHEEHDPTPASVVAPGVTYRVIQQQEMDLKGQWRKVQD